MPWETSGDEVLVVEGIVKREIFLLTAENPTKSEGREAVHHFLGFLYLFAFSLSAYAFRFDSQETFKPDWANVFG